MRFPRYKNPFLVDKLQSPIGLAVLYAMRALYQKGPSVKYRPGLELDNVSAERITTVANFDGLEELCLLCSGWFCC
jgi:hypothetical protein